MYNQLGNNEEKDVIVPEVISSISALDLVTIECGFIHSIGLGKWVDFYFSSIEDLFFNFGL